MSKSTVSASLAILHEQKAFDWEDPVSKYLPEFRLYDDFASKEIRVLDLLIHNCGLRSESAGTIWYGSDYSRTEIIRKLRFLRPVSSFRSNQAYQNVCFLAAGLIIQAITGQTWDDFVTQNIFSPLHMLRTFPNIASLRLSASETLLHHMR
jgi:CubicO group peptidase (beta-lactamase class C family)